MTLLQVPADADPETARADFEGRLLEHGALAAPLVWRPTGPDGWQAQVLPG